MALITEASLRAQFKKETPVSICLKPSDIVTPSAKQFLQERGVALIESEEQHQAHLHERMERPVKENFYRDFRPINKAFKPKYISAYDGGVFEEKPEHMTHLKGNKLIFKDDVRIVLRGRIDSLESLIMEIQLQLFNAPAKEIIENLDEILDVVRRLLRAEVIDEPIAIETLFGLNDAELREHSHHPQKYYGIEHFLPDVSMGLEVVLLNKLRTEIREVELVAMKTFKTDYSVSRDDIIKVFNRLSSAIYILMCRVRSNYYLKK